VATESGTDLPSSFAPNQDAPILSSTRFGTFLRTWLSPRLDKSEDLQIVSFLRAWLVPIKARKSALVTL